MNLDCLGSDNAGWSYQPRLIALPIVPDYSGRLLTAKLATGFYLSIVKVTTEYPANGSSRLEPRTDA
jgi:hypothetical protein